MITCDKCKKKISYTMVLLFANHEFCGDCQFKCNRRIKEWCNE